ncbi:MAG: 2-succinyl-5-enolpyruvyl-6-hydroxy-3-cyclohexene-1-carboxylic-acid synthase [Rhodocyclaceae bacterium]|nr:2-succinyl-5-enolpyruvyl-6-hydroxy-3-cyclohexene-1-carboxylic-acid synthase [Rhodocyclaceae bacterium]
MTPGSFNLACADTLWAAFAAAGLRHVVLCPGSRSAPLAIAAMRRPGLVCHVINDERAAGYFALGIGKASGMPAAVVVTSGTAAANLFPAIVEAQLSHTPLVAITADRPPELVGWGANQTIAQFDLFAGHLRARHLLPVPSQDIPPRFFSALAWRSLQESLGPPAGPVHLNLPFSEPLLPANLALPLATPQPPAGYRTTPSFDAASLEALAAQLCKRPGVIVCGAMPGGEDFGAALVRLAQTLSAPIIAEALSALRYGAHHAHVCAHAPLFLREATLPPPAWVLRFGGFPLSRTLERWLAERTDCAQILVAAPETWNDPIWRATMRVEADAAAFCDALATALPPVADTGFALAWQAAEQKAARDAAKIAAERFFEGTLARCLVERLPADAQLFVGNSLAIRALDAFGGTRPHPLRLFANRGASGIDGNLATAAGLAAATGAPTIALVGDQTLLHDATSLALCRRHEVTVVVLNNRGGGIFTHLPYADAIPRPILEAAFVAPPEVDFSALAHAFALRHRRITNPHEAMTACAALPTASLIEAVIDLAVSRAAFGLEPSESASARL